MSLIADALLAAGALGAAIYCFVLARRLKRFTQLEHGMGGAIAVLSAQVDDLTRALENAERAAKGSGERLAADTARAEQLADRLELLLAATQQEPRTSQARDSEPPRRARVLRHRSARRRREEEVS